MARPKIGVALGGGGARGYAHIGVLRILQQEGVPIDIVVGTSMGAIIGGAYAVGLDMTKLEKILTNLDLNKLLDLPSSPVATVAGRIASEFLTRTDWRKNEQEETKNLCQFFSVFTKGLEFKDLKRVKFAVVAADIDTGEEVVIQEGPLHRAIAASATVPGLHYPIRYNDRFLVDGGIVNKLPADVALRLGAEVVIAVEVSSPLAKGVKNSIEVLTQAETITGRELMRMKLERVRERLGERLILLQPALDRVSMLSLDQVAAAARAGEREAWKHLDRIKALVFPAPA
ncbi:MAG: patatin-like phospholipase family protein [Candidatus Bipolaricaulia bacterium]